MGIHGLNQFLDFWLCLREYGLAIEWVLVAFSCSICIRWLAQVELGLATCWGRVDAAALQQVRAIDARERHLDQHLRIPPKKHA